jgi:hypothetical protein
MSSILTDLRNEVVASIVSIATIPTTSGGLGLDAATTVNDYLLEFEHDEKKTNYLNASVSNRKILRSYGVQVTQTVEPRSTSQTYQYNYNIIIQLYYKMSQANDLIDAATNIQESILQSQITCMLYNWYINDLTITKTSFETEEGEGLLGEFTITGSSI